MWIFSRKYIVWASTAYILAALGFFIFDLSLNLGQFSYLVFSLWTAYFSIAFAFVNTVVGIYFFSKDKKVRNSSFIMVGAAVLVLAIIWGAGSIL